MAISASSARACLPIPCDVSLTTRASRQMGTFERSPSECIVMQSEVSVDMAYGGSTGGRFGQHVWPRACLTMCPQGDPLTAIARSLSVLCYLAEEGASAASTELGGSCLARGAGPVLVSG